MSWLFGILFVITLLTWVGREIFLRKGSERLEALLSDLAKGRTPADFQIEGVFFEHGQQAALIAKELTHLHRQRELAEANLQIILSSMQEGVLVADSRRTLRLANPAARKLFTLPANVLGLPVLDTLREPAVDTMIATALKTGEPQESELEIAGRKPPLILVVNVTPMRDATGEAGALVMFRDITRLTQLEQVRREFVANVSHELRTPLAIFQGYVENLQDAPDMSAEDRQETFAILAKHSQRLNALVEDLLILARLEARQHEMEIETLEVADFCSELARDWAVRLAKKNVTLRLDIAEGLPVIEGDRMRLEQVFNNLLDNALKYTPEGSMITFGAALVNDMVDLWVKDEGQGILSADLPHIFERFYRADKARSRELGGTGLGLSIVKHIAQAHGGSVSAESTYGQGLAVHVRLPRN